MYLQQGLGAAQGCGHGWGLMLPACEQGSSIQARSARCLSQWQWAKLKSSYRSLCNCLKKVILQRANQHVDIIIIFLRGSRDAGNTGKGQKNGPMEWNARRFSVSWSSQSGLILQKILTRYYRRIHSIFLSLLNPLEESKLQLVTRVLLIRPVSLEVPRKILLNSRSQHSKRKLINPVPEIQQFSKVKQEQLSNGAL